MNFNTNLFMFSLDRCNGRCNSLNDTSGRICFPDKTKDVSLNVYNMITRRNEAKTLTKVVSSDCKCKFVVGNIIKIKIRITINTNVYVKKQ